MNNKSALLRASGLFLALAIVWGCGGSGGGVNNPPGDSRPILFAMTNGSGENRVHVYRVNDNGSLIDQGSYGTGGAGSPTEVPGAAGAADGVNPLGSQGSLSVSANQDFLFCVNAGAGSVTSFQITANGSLNRADAQPTGGTNPVSVASRSGRVYVANVNDPGGGQRASVTGFSVDGSGELTPIAGSTQDLSAANSHPACIAISPDNTRLLVTEQGTNVISTFAINADGSLGTAVTTASTNPMPGGIDFFGQNRVLISEMNGGADSSVSSYAIAANGTLTPISGAISSGQRSGGWVKVNGSNAFTSNLTTNNVAAYGISDTGVLAPGASVGAGVANGAPIDSAAAGGMFFQLLGARGTVGVYRINAGGNLSLVSVQATGLPATGVQGLAAR